MALERNYQAALIKRILKRFVGCYVEKNDANRRQGIPDLTIYFVGGMWAMLEVKASASSPVRPNQEWYVAKYNEMAFCRFIYPENEEAVLHELEQEYQAYRSARVP